MVFETILKQNKIEQRFKYFNPILDQGYLPWLIAFVKKWAQRNRNNSKLMQLENLDERYGKFNN